MAYVALAGRGKHILSKIRLWNDLLPAYDLIDHSTMWRPISDKKSD